MRLIIGTYRGTRYLPACLDSLERNVTGIDELVFVDDSGRPEVSAWLRQYGEVVEAGGAGYQPAMQLVCEAMREPYSCFWEEDCTADAPINLEELADELRADPQLVQIGLLRQPTFEGEISAGGIIERLRGIGDVRDVHGVHRQLHKHQLSLYGNAAVWAPQLWFWGWPQCCGSEDVKTMQLREHDGLWFAYTVERLITHHGEREGYGY